MRTERDRLLWGPLTLGRLRVIAGRLGLTQSMWSHLPPREEKRKLKEYIFALLDALDRQGMTIERYVEVISMSSSHLPQFPPFGAGRGGLV